MLNGAEGESVKQTYGIWNNNNNNKDVNQLPRLQSWLISLTWQLTREVTVIWQLLTLTCLLWKHTPSQEYVATVQTEVIQTNGSQANTNRINSNYAEELFVYECALAVDGWALPCLWGGDTSVAVQTESDPSRSHFYCPFYHSRSGDKCPRLAAYS